MNIKLCMRSKSSFWFFIPKYSSSLLTCHAFHHRVNKVIVPPRKSPSIDDVCIATSDLLLMISVEKRPYLGSNLVPTLANLQVHNFTHFVRLRPIGGYNLTRALQLQSPEQALCLLLLSATPSTAWPQGPFYTRGTVTQPARGVASPRHCTGAPLLPGYRCNSTGASPSGLESNIVTCTLYNWFQFSVQQCDARIYVHILVVFHYFILDIIYIQMYVHM